MTACDDDPFPSRLMRAGASAFALGKADLQKSRVPFCVVAAGQRYISPGLLKNGLRPFDAPDDDVFEAAFRNWKCRSLMIGL